MRIKFICAILVNFNCKTEKPKTTYNFNFFNVKYS